MNDLDVRLNIFVFCYKAPFALSFVLSLALLDFIFCFCNRTHFLNNNCPLGLIKLVICQVIYRVSNYPKP